MSHQFPARRLSAVRVDGAPAGLAGAGLDDRDDPPRRSAGRPAALDRAEPGDLRPALPLHRDVRGDPPGRVLRLSPVRPRRARRRPGAIPRRRADRADDLDPRGGEGRGADPVARRRARRGCWRRSPTTTRSTSSLPAGGSRRPRPTWTRHGSRWRPGSGRGCTWKTQPARRSTSCLRSSRRCWSSPSPTVPDLRPKFRVCDTMGLGLAVRRCRDCRGACRSSSAGSGHWACSRRTSSFIPTTTPG